MKVYRIQDKYGRGPWKPGFSSKWVEFRPDHENLIPSYEEFGIDVFRYPYAKSGCKTIDQLKRWFTESEYNKLHNYGYRAYEIKTKKLYAESEIQIIFRDSNKFKEIELY